MNTHKLRILDNGQTEGEFENIFERFYRVDKSRDRRTVGSDLGLAIVKRMVTLSGGTAEVSSRRGEGAYFTVRWAHSL